MVGDGFTVTVTWALSVHNPAVPVTKKVSVATGQAMGLATAVSENGETIEEVYEPFLIQQGFLIRTPRGREVTELAYKHLGRLKNNQEGLF